MTDKEKLEAIRAEIHRLVDIRGYDREMANDLFTFMDSLPNEPVSDFEMALTEMIDKAQKCVVEPWAIAAQWKDYLIELAKSEESTSIWHDSNKEQPNFASTVVTWSPKYKNGEIISRCTEVYSDRIWAYIDDLLKNVML